MAIAVAFVIRCTGAGAELRSPQHSICPVESSAQDCRSPEETAVAFEMPATGTGVLLFVVEPSPSSPYWLSPQQSIPPVGTNAHE
jgi:hypothetical protein